MAKKMSQDAGPGAGHNSLCDPNLFAEHYRRLTAADIEFAQAKANRSNVLAAAKRAGVPLDLLKEARADSKIDREELENEIRLRALAQSWIGRPLGFQAQMFAVADEPHPNETQVAAIKLSDAEEQGYTDAIHGSPRENNRHIAGSDLAAAWDTGWHKGHDFLERSGKLADRAQQPRGRRGRSQGNGADPQPAAVS